MKELKLFEVRDRATRISAIAIRLVYNFDGSADDFIMGSTGYRGVYVLFGRLDDAKLVYDTFAWSNNRTMATAHEHVLKNWDNLKSGDVIDVEYILGESTVPKKSDGI